MTMIQERIENVRSFDGNELNIRLYTPAKKESNGAKISGLLLAVHGLAEHSGRYLHVAKATCNKNLACAIFDLRGHGKSGPTRGDAENFQSMILDILFVLDYAKKSLELPKNCFVALLGHSFGGLLVTYASSIISHLELPIFLSAPCYGVKKNIPLWKKFMAYKLSYLYPQLNVPIGISFSDLSNNNVSNDKAKNDPLYLTSGSARLGSLFLSALNDENIVQAIKNIKSAVTIIAAGEDKLVDTNTIKNYFPYFANKKSELHIIEKSGHEAFNEIEVYQKEIFSIFEKWLENSLMNYQ